MRQDDSRTNARLLTMSFLHLHLRNADRQTFCQSVSQSVSQWLKWMMRATLTRGVMRRGRSLASHLSYAEGITHRGKKRDISAAIFAERCGLWGLRAECNSLNLVEHG